MNNQEILTAILSKNDDKLAEAKNAIKGMLDAKASSFRTDATKFIAKSMFSGGN